MKIYTSYFNNLKNLPQDYVPVAICGGVPDWYEGLWTRKVAPKWKFFQEWKQNHDNNFYIEHFNSEVLDMTTPEIFIDLLKKITNNAENIVLICYEKPDEFCHRHLVASWITQKTGIEVTEFNGNK